MAKHLNIVLYVEQALFRGRQLVTARQKIAGYSLRMPAEEWPTRMKRFSEEVIVLLGSGGAM
jgi:hypothetical protein